MKDTEATRVLSYTHASLMKPQFVVTHTIRQTEIPTLLDSWITNTPSVNILCPQQNILSLYFRKNITCLNVGLLRFCQVFFLSPVKFCIGGLRQISVS
jgi:hypothetical protein